MGKLRGGLAPVRPDDLLAHVLAAAVERAGIEAADISEVVAGCANQAGEDNRNVARMASLLAGFPYEVPAYTVNRLCASGLTAVVQAARAVRLGEAEAVLAGGVESMSRAPWVLAKPQMPFASGNRTAYDTALGWRFANPRLEARFPLEAMGETAENLAEQFAIGREAQDVYALGSHQRALVAWEHGRFADEVVAVDVPQKKTTVRCERDEGPRVDTSLDKLARLAPAFREGGSVTAGNASTLNDGAAAVLVTTPELARRLGKRPLARIVGAASAGVDPRYMGTGPIPATRKVLKMAGWRMTDVELCEINEAFAVQVLAVSRELGVDGDRLNVNGGAIALGHPLGASGARILTTLVHEMKRRGARRGLASLCVGVGQGESILVERDA